MRHSPTPRIVLTCGRCNREFLRHQADFRKAHSTSQYCSRTCYAASRTAKPAIVGVYAIDYLPAARWYIGASTDIATRWAWHRSALRRGAHENAPLQTLWTQDIEAAFRFRVLEVVADVESLREREQNWLDRFQRLFPGFGLNLHLTAGSPAGYSPSRETRAKISAANLGKTLSAETRAKISAAKMGNPGRPSFGLEHRSLSVEQAIAIKRLLADGVYRAEVARITGTSRHTVGRMSRGELYLDVAPDLNGAIRLHRTDGRKRVRHATASTGRN